MRRIFTLPDIVVFGRVRIIQNWPLCDNRLFIMALSETGKHIGKKIFMAINNRRNNLCPDWIYIGNDDIKNQPPNNAARKPE